MPYRQHPTVGRAIRFSRSDHTIPVPRPASDQAMGLPSACGLCHRDKTAAELDAAVHEWYGEPKPRHSLVQGILDLEAGMDEAAARDLLLQPDETHPMAQAQALWVYVRRYLRPDLGVMAPEAETRLRQLSDQPDPDVRALALAGLHLAAGRDPETRTFLAGRLEALGEEDLAIRRRWVLALRTLGDRYLESGDLDGAVRAYGRALEVLPEHPGVLSDLALAHSTGGQLEAALAFYDRSLDADPGQSQILVNRGVVLENLGRGEEAIASFRLATERNPGEALAHLNLGNVHFVRGEYAEAAEAYRQAVRHNPRLVNGHLMLAQSLILLGLPDSAAISARNVLEFEPTNEAAQRMLADLVGGPGDQDGS